MPAPSVARALRPGDVVLVSGELGAGKTTFVRGALRALGVTEPVTSPTFVVGTLYEGAAGRLAHLDLYRLAGLEDEDPGLLDPYFGPRDDHVRRVAGARRRARRRPRAGVPRAPRARRRRPPPDHRGAVGMNARLEHAGGDRRRIAVEGAVLGLDTATPATAVALLRADGQASRPATTRRPVARAARQPPAGPDRARARRRRADVGRRRADRGRRRPRRLHRPADRDCHGARPRAGAGARARRRRLARSAGRRRARPPGRCRHRRPPRRSVRRRLPLAARRCWHPPRWRRRRSETRSPALDPVRWRWGTGRYAFRRSSTRAGATVPPADAPVHRLSAVHVCRLGAVGEPAARDALLPDYLREPDAKPSVTQPQPT